jgi:hypothetical protein
MGVIHKEVVDMKTFRRASQPPVMVLCTAMILALAAGGFASQQSDDGSEAQASMRGIFITLTTA